MTTAAETTNVTETAETPSQEQQAFLTAAIAATLGSSKKPENFHAVVDTYAPPIRALLALLMAYHVVQPKTLVREEKNKASDYYSMSTQLVVSLQDPVPEEVSPDLLTALTRYSYSLSGSSTPAIVALGNTPALFQKAVPNFAQVQFTQEQLTANPQLPAETAKLLDHHAIGGVLYKLNFATLTATDPSQFFTGLNNADLVEYMALVTRLYEMAVAAVVDTGEGALGNNILNMNIRTQETTRLKLELFLIRILLTYFVK